MNINYYNYSRKCFSLIANKSLEEMGSYDPFYYYINFSKKIEPLIPHIDLFSKKGGCFVDTNDDIYISSDKVPTYFATYLHETIHWWQTIGSSSGFVNAFVQKLQSYSTLRLLKNIPVEIVLTKPLVNQIYLDENFPYETSRWLNGIVNTWMDLEFASLLLFDPHEAINLRNREDFFESIVHSYFILLTEFHNLIEDILDEGSDIFVNQDLWSTNFNRLKEIDAPNFSFNSDLVTPPEKIGLIDVYEGQARFNEMQYLYKISNKKLDLRYFEKNGYLTGIYSSAFEIFLKYSKFDKPSSLSSLAVFIFLAVCDISINGGVGYPFDIVDFGKFDEDFNPSMRFLKASQTARIFHKINADANQIDRLFYNKIILTICKLNGWFSPLDNSKRILNISRRFLQKNFIDDLNSSEPSWENISNNFIFSHHLNFLKDKNEFPELFTWPGWILSSENEKINTYEIIWIRNRVPFVKLESKKAIIYRSPSLYSNESKYSAQYLSQYFNEHMLFDLLNQLVVKPGPFDFNYRWFDENWNIEDYKKSLSKVFHENTGRHIDSFKF